MIKITISDKLGYILDEFKISADVKQPDRTDNELSNEVRDHLGFRFDIPDDN